MKETPFIITINDGYCTWEYGLNFTDNDNLCIDDIVKGIEESLNASVTYSKCIKEHE